MDIAIRNGNALKRVHNVDGVDYTFTRQSIADPLVCRGVPTEAADVFLSKKNARLFYALGTDAPLARNPNAVSKADADRLRAEARAEAERDAAKAKVMKDTLDELTSPDAGGTVLTPTPPAPAKQPSTAKPSGHGKK